MLAHLTMNQTITDDLNSSTSDLMGNDISQTATYIITVTNLSTTTHSVPSSPNIVYPETLTEINIRRFFCVFYLLFGTFGNLLSIAVLSTKNVRHRKLSMQLIGLEISDTMLLWVTNIRSFGQEFLDVDLQTASDFTCKCYWFFVYWAHHCSTWLIVSLTIERTVSVWFPWKAKVIWTKKVTVVTLSTITVLFFFFDLHLMIAYVSNPSETIPLYPDGCGRNTVSYAKFFLSDFVQIHFAIGFLIPFMCILSGNILIIIRTYLQKNKFRSTLVAPMTGTGSHAFKRYKGMKQLTVLLLTLSSIFLISQLPVAIYLQMRPHFSEIFTTPRSLARLGLVREIVFVLSYMNFSANFLVYCFSASYFRAELKTIICKLSGRPQTAQTITITANSETLHT